MGVDSDPVIGNWKVKSRVPIPIRLIEAQSRPLSRLGSRRNRDSPNSRNPGQSPGVGELGLWVSGLCSRCPPIAHRACGHTAMAASWSARELRPPGRESMAGASVLFGGRSHGPRECQRLSGSHSMGSPQLRPHSRHHHTEVIRHGCHRVAAVAAEGSHTLEHKRLPLPFDSSFEPVAGRA